MKKLNWFLMAMLLATLPALQSCDESDGHSIGDIGRDWATVHVISGHTYSLDGDRWGTIWPVATDIPWYQPIDGQRVIALFNPLYDNFEGYDLGAKINHIRPIPTKQVEELTSENSAEFGNDPVTIYENDMWISGGYLNIVFMQNLPKKKLHLVSLVYESTVDMISDGYIHLEYRYNTYGDVTGYWTTGAVSFNLNSKIPVGTKGIKVKINSAKNGMKEVVFDLKEQPIPETVKNIDFSMMEEMKIQ